MDLQDRYVYAVTRRLPQRQREDIDKELRTLIDDMLEQYKGNESQEIKLQKVLLDLGDPEVLADNYRDTKHYLIGPQNYDNYVRILKIVFGAVFLGISIATVVGNISSARQADIGIFTGYLATLFSALLQAFAWVTAGFAIAERRGIVMDKLDEKDSWNISQLPEVPPKKAVIHPSEPIASILFTTLFMSILYFSPQIFAAYVPNPSGGTIVIPVFDINVVHGYKLLFAGIFLFMIFKEALKLIYGRWTLKVAAASTALSLVSTILTVIVFSNHAIWNPEFEASITKYAGLGVEFGHFWSVLTGWFVVIIIAAFILEAATAIYKGMRYR